MHSKLSFWGLKVLKCSQSLLGEKLWSLISRRDSSLSLFISSLKLNSLIYTTSRTWSLYSLPLDVIAWSQKTFTLSYHPILMLWRRDHLQKYRWIVFEEVQNIFPFLISFVSCRSYFFHAHNCIVCFVNINQRGFLIWFLKIKNELVFVFPQHFF